MKGDIGISEIGTALALALGAIAPIVVNRSIELAGIAKDVPFLAVSAVVFGVVGTLSTYLIRAPLSVVAVLVFGGIAIGTVADSAIDQFAFSREHNLLPQEIFAMWTIALIPGAAGLLLGERLRRSATASPRRPHD